MSAPVVVKRLDVRPLKAAGIHPVEQVLQELAALGPDEAFQVVTPHTPAPLIERAAALGLAGTTVELDEETFVTTFTRAAPGRAP